MDFLYTDLNEIVDNYEYLGVESDGTISVVVDNNKRTIQASLNSLKGNLLINDGELIEIYNGTKDKVVSIPRYKIVELDTQSSGDTRKAYRLMQWDYESQQYVATDSDVIYLSELVMLLNIENGQVSGSEVSNKIGLGNSGLSSTNYKHREQFNINAYDVDLPINSVTDSTTNENIIGTNINDIIEGGSVTGIQSVALGGQPVGISKINMLLVVCSGISYKYNIINDKPFTISSTTDKRTYVENNGILYIGDIESGITLYVLRNVDGQVRVNVLPNDINRIKVNIVKGYNDSPTAKGNQSISVGGGTHADKEWSQAFGLGTTTSSSGLMVIGSFNQDEEDALFIIGNGTYNVTTGETIKSNAFAFLKDGTIKLGNNNDKQVIVTEDYLNKYRVDYGILT